MDSQTLAHIFDPFVTTKPPAKTLAPGRQAHTGSCGKAAGTSMWNPRQARERDFCCTFQSLSRLSTRRRACPDRRQPGHGRKPLCCLWTMRRPRGKLSPRFYAAPVTASWKLLLSEEALQIAGDYPGAINLLVTEVVMPGLRRPEFYQRILAPQPRVRVLFMSGCAEGLPETQLQQGAAFLQKPFSFAALLESLRSLQCVN
jgi:two-component system, cell cycle sensor histidine kinase and response regulator CckA